MSLALVGLGFTPKLSCFTLKLKCSLARVPSSSSSWVFNPSVSLGSLSCREEEEEDSSGRWERETPLQDQHESLSLQGKSIHAFSIWVPACVCLSVCVQAPSPSSSLNIYIYISYIIMCVRITLCFHFDLLASKGDGWMMKGWEKGGPWFNIFSFFFENSWDWLWGSWCGREIQAPLPKKSNQSISYQWLVLLMHNQFEPHTDTHTQICVTHR